MENMEKVLEIERLLTNYYELMDDLDDAYESEFDELPCNEAGEVIAKELLALNKKYREAKENLKATYARLIKEVE